MLGIADWDKGSATAGNRGYYLVGDGVLLNQVPEIDYCGVWWSEKIPSCSPREMAGAD